MNTRDHATWDATTRTAVYFGVYERDGVLRVARITRIGPRQTESIETGRTFPATLAGQRAANDYMTDVNCRRIVAR